MSNSATTSIMPQKEVTDHVRVDSANLNNL